MERNKGLEKSLSHKRAEKEEEEAKKVFIFIISRVVFSFTIFTDNSISCLPFGRLSEVKSEAFPPAPFAVVDEIMHVARENEKWERRPSDMTKS